MKTLNLTLHRAFFEQILSGSKKIEYRERKPLYDKKFTRSFDFVKFVNGYGNHRPWLISEISEIKKTEESWEIHLAKVLDAGNLHLLNPY
jgi:hypothetical protein